jgi:carboxypeptidase C (cathepsin A)
MKKIVVSCLVFVFVFSAIAQQKPSASANDIPFNPDQSVTADHEITIRGVKVPYKTITGMMPVWDTEGKVQAGVFYTYYERSDVKDRASRPLLISFNGGPGTSSLWMELGYTGPRIVNIDDEGYPLQPYGLKDNPHSILDATDIVFVDPVNTGFSRAVSKDIPTSRFFGVNADIKYLAEWINTFVSRMNRWASPKYLIGESRQGVWISFGTAELPLDVCKWSHFGFSYHLGYRTRWSVGRCFTIAVLCCNCMVS